MKKKDISSGVSLITEWLTPAMNFSLKGNAVHVWRASLDMPDGQIEMLVGSSSPDEVSQREKYHY